jgi:hypothetical protein
MTVRSGCVRPWRAPSRATEVLAAPMASATRSSRAICGEPSAIMAPGSAEFSPAGPTSLDRPVGSAGTERTPSTSSPSRGVLQAPRRRCRVRVRWRASRGDVGLGDLVSLGPQRIGPRVHRYMLPIIPIHPPSTSDGGGGVARFTPAPRVRSDERAKTNAQHLEVFDSPPGPAHNEPITPPRPCRCGGNRRSPATAGYGAPPTVHKYT